MDINLVNNMMENVIKDRQLNGIRNHSCVANETPYLYIDEIITKEVYKLDYNTTTFDFIVGNQTYEEVISTFKNISDSNIIPNTIKNYSN